MDTPPAPASPSIMPFMSHFGDIPDHRVVGRTDHKLYDIIFIAVCACIAACDDWKTIGLWAKARKKWLAKFCELPNGIPSACTFRRFFRNVDPEALQLAFIAWMNDLNVALDGKTVAIDGKTARRSFCRADGKGPIHVISAWMGANRMVLGQMKTDEKSNEITAIPELLRLLEIRGSIVTIDAIGCQKAIAKAIRENEADYCLAVKENQPNLLRDIRATFEEAPEEEVIRHTTREENRGRIETRSYAQTDDLSRIRALEEWDGLASVVRVESKRAAASGESHEIRYYITSLGKGVRRLANAIRQHWGIENSLHYVLDVTFREDYSRIREGNGAESMATLRRLAMNFINNARDMKLSVKNRRMCAAFDNSVLEKILGF